MAILSAGLDGCLKLLDDVLVPGERIADTVFFIESQRDAATGAAITYCVEILPALDDGMDKTSLVTLP